MVRLARLSTTTVDYSASPSTGAAPAPALLLLAAPGRRSGATIPLGRPVALGRETADGLLAADARLSRRHATVIWDGACHVVIDEGSRNGTFLDGQRVVGTARVASPRVLRLGHSVFTFVPDLARFAAGGARIDGDEVIGPALAEARQLVAQAARARQVLLLTGESGTGKELAARAFHDGGHRARGPFVALNCAALPDGMAERLLFGTRRGAYSGADDDAPGFVQAAHGGTLFLDEIAELPLLMQAKLLRVLETREVTPLGATRPVQVDLGLCAATLRDLAERVADGRFREDLFYRIARPEVRLPPLRERLEEVPLLVERELGRVAPSLTAHPGLIEAIALRAWPGNVRELLREIQRLGAAVAAAGRSEVRADDLAAGAGNRLARGSGTDLRLSGGSGIQAEGELDTDSVERALTRSAGNVSAAARLLGVHRNRLRRWLDRRAGDDREPLGCA
jgi:transcriptional regulator with PAS, ATPase and Fis domain